MRSLLARMAAGLLAAVLFLSNDVYGISAKNGILVDANTGRVIYEKTPDERALIASTTKIMTALLICEQCNVLDRMRIPAEAVGIEGSSFYLREGEILTIQELLYGLMLHSGNDAATALAIYCGGTIEGFVQLMNDKAHRLGLSGTHFDNPHGLDSPGQYSTARDMAHLATYAMNNPIFAQVVSTKSVSAGGRTLRNHNKLLWRLEGADGVKTGFTKAAGRILVSSATRQGRRLIAVTMNAPDDWNDHITMINQGFQKYVIQQILEPGDCVGYVEIAGGDAGSVELVAAEGFSFPLAQDEEYQLVLQQPGFVYAPVAKEQQAGYVYICIGDSVVGKVPVVYGETVEQMKEEKPSFWQRIFRRG